MSEDTKNTFKQMYEYVYGGCTRLVENSADFVDAWLKNNRDPCLDCADRLKSVCKYFSDRLPVICYIEHLNLDRLYLGVDLSRSILGW